jgi:hypothetical protein
MEFLKKVFLGYSGYPMLLGLHVIIYDFMTAIFFILGIIAMNIHQKDINNFLSHPISIGVIGGFHIFLFYLFKTYTNESIFLEYLVSGAILLYIVFTGMLFILGIKRHVLLK